MSQKIYVCSKVEYINIEDVVSTTQDAIIVKNGKTITGLRTAKATFTETLSVSVNDYVSQKLDIAIIGIVLSNTYAGRRFIFRLTLSTGQQIIWGSAELPVRINNLSKDTNEQNLSFIRTGKTFALD